MKRENRYLVVKRDDINAYLTTTEHEILITLIDKIYTYKQQIENKNPHKYVVISENWEPLYEKTWKNLEEYINNVASN